MLDERHLRYFIAVAEDLNFTRAAERLHTVQPSLSMQIRKLEDIVGTPLFVRDKHHVELTEPGRVFLREARILLQQAQHAVTLTRQAARGGSRTHYDRLHCGRRRKGFVAHSSAAQDPVSSGSVVAPEYDHLGANHRTSER